MSNFLRKMDDWAEEEDEPLMDYYKKLYGPLMTLSLLFPSYRRSFLGQTFAIAGFYFITMVCHFLLLTYSIVKVSEDFTLASLLIHFWLIMFFAFTSFFCVNFNRSELAKAHRLMSMDLGQYASGRIYDDDVPQKLEKGKRKELFKFLPLPGLVMIIAALVIIVPYLKKLSEEKENGDVHYTESGVNLNLPVAVYYPFPTHAGIMHMIALLFQALTAVGLVTVLVSLELLLFMVSHAVIFEYKVLQHGIDTIFLRARTLCQIKYPEKKSVGGRCDFLFQGCIYVCLKDCVKHHHRIQELTEVYEFCIKWPVASAYGIGTAVMGLSLVNILNARNSEEGDFENMTLFFLLLMAETLNMYIISAFGESIADESAVLRNVLYFIDWDELNVRNRKLLINFQTGITKPVILKAGGLVALSMDTFSSIMNTAYSFFNLMNAS